jgi:hypothetical protein
MTIDRRAVRAIKNIEMGRLKKINGDPLLMDKDWRKYFSNRSPKMNPRIRGARAQFLFLMMYPKPPKPSATQTSNSVFLGE